MSAPRPLRLLVLGGTAFVGRHVVAAALERGFAVTCLARGRSGDVPGGARLLSCDRDREGVPAVLVGEFDAAIDLARQPGHVRRSAYALRERVGHWVFVSSANVYADQSLPGADETATVVAPLAGDLMPSMEQYANAKVACERHVDDAFPGRATIVRAALIGGPGDPYGRSGYWPWRFAHPSNAVPCVAAPDDRDRTVQVLDVRDLAQWLCELVERRSAGIFNAGGADHRLEDVLKTAQAVARSDATIAWIDPATLAANGVGSWMGSATLPLWVDEPGWEGFNAASNASAVAAGLVRRPLAVTLRDELNWEERRPPGAPRHAGLTDNEERTLLERLGCI